MNIKVKQTSKLSVTLQEVSVVANEDVRLLVEAELNERKKPSTG